MNGSYIAAMIAAAALLTFSGCSVEKTEEGEMPKVKVEGGNLPKYDVKTADVDINTTKATITVPDVDVKTEKKDVTVPNVDVKMPSEKK